MRYERPKIGEMRSEVREVFNLEHFTYNHIVNHLMREM